MLIMVAGVRLHHAFCVCAIRVKPANARWPDQFRSRSGPKLSKPLR
jgi:hypothetical protein